MTEAKFDVGDFITDESFGIGMIIEREWDDRKKGIPHDGTDVSIEVNEWKYKIRFPSLAKTHALNSGGIYECALDYMISKGMMKIKRTKKDALEKRTPSND